MPRKVIRLDEIDFPMDSGKPFTFDGIFSGNKMAGIEISFTVSGSEQEKMVENLLNKNKVQVEDPFIDRTYETTTFMKQNSFQVGKGEKSYVIELKEIDYPPHVYSVEIDETRLEVLKYEETLIDGKIRRHALLKVPNKQFDQFRILILNPSVKFKRIGVDESHLELRVGGESYWSQHDEDGEKYFKHNLWFLPLDSASSKLTMASGIIQTNMARILISLSAKFEILVKELSENKCISPEKQQALLSSGWTELFPKEEINKICDSFEQVEDAENEFDRTAY